MSEVFNPGDRVKCIVGFAETIADAPRTGEEFTIGSVTPDGVWVCLNEDPDHEYLAWRFELVSRAVPTPDPMEYWKKGTDIIEECLRIAERGEWEDAPFPLGPGEARLWHRAQAEAYRHALEMMGVPPSMKS